MIVTNLKWIQNVLTKNRTCSGPYGSLSKVFLGIFLPILKILKFGLPAFYISFNNKSSANWTNIVRELMDSLVLRWCNLNRTTFLLFENRSPIHLSDIRNPAFSKWFVSITFLNNLLMWNYWTITATDFKIVKIYRYRY